MTNLLQFLQDNPVDDIKQTIKVSERLKKFPFEITAMTGLQFNSYQKLATKIDGKNKKVNFDSSKFNELVIINHTTEPNFKDAKSIKDMGVITPEQFLYKTLLAGEISELSSRISSLSGFDKESYEIEEAEAKNS